MDLSKLSDADLTALHSGDMSKVSNEGLSYLHEAFGKEPGGSDATAVPTNFFPGEDAARTKLGFSDPATAAKALLAQGLKNPHMVNGDWVAQDAQGRTVKDLANFFPNQMNQTPVRDLSSAAQAAKEILGSAHPINWLEKNAGASLPTGGMLTGGILGTGAGAMTGNPLIAMGGGVTGAGLGGGMGELAREAIGKQMGVYKPALVESPESHAALTQEALSSGGAELAGQWIGRIPLPLAAGGSVGGLVSKGISKVAAIPSYLAMGGKIPYSDVARVIERPGAVSGAGARDFPLDTATRMESELGGTVRDAKTQIREAHDAFKASNPELSTKAQAALDQHLNDNLEWLDKHSPNSTGDSRVTPEEHQEILQDTLRMAVAPPGELLTMAQRLSEDLPQSAYTGGVSRRSPVADAQAKRMAGQIKDALHIQSTPLETADKEFGGVMDQAKTLRPVEGEGQEGVVKNIWGPTTVSRTRAAQALTPKTYGTDLLDLRAKQAFDKAGAFGATPLDQGAKLLGGTLLGSGTYAASHSSPEAAAAMAAYLLATSPKANYMALQGMGRVAGQALPLTARKLSPWSLLNPEKGN